MLTLMLTVWMGMTVSAKTYTFKRYWFLNSKGKILGDNSNKYHYDLVSAGILNPRNLKTSNKKVAAAKITGQYGYNFITTTLKKPGKATVSFTGDYRGRKNCKIKFVHMIARYANPFKTLKIGSTDLAGLFNKKMDVYRNLNGCSGELNLALKKGWKLKKIVYYPNEDVEDELKAVNHQQISFNGTGCYLEIILQNTKLKQPYSFMISEP